MLDLETRMVPARRAPHSSERNRIGAGRALAGEIWGANYAGTIPSYGVPVTSTPNVLPESARYPGIMYSTVGAGPTTAFISPSSLAELYWQRLKPLSSDIGVAVWERDGLIALPAGLSPPAPDLMFWTNEGHGASSVLIVAEAKLAATDPSDASHAPAWRRIFEAHSTAKPHAVIRQPTVNRDAHSELRLLLDWTRLPIEQLGALLGASRRTIYNWLAERPIREAAQSRIFRFRDALVDVAASRDPALVRAWLLRGDPSPATLAAEERWDELEARAREDMSFLRPIDSLIEEAGGEARAESSEVLTAALLAFSTAPVKVSTPRPAWRPREDTGIASDEEEAAE